MNESNSPMILVADDDVEDQEMLMEYFLGGGLDRKDVTFVTNGRAAIEYLQRHDTLPKLVVLDLKMPIMDGQSTLLHIKSEEKFKRIPVVMYSTSSNEQDRRKCLVNGALEYFVKPSSYDEGEMMANRLIEFLQRQV
ncbi:response regulator [Chryseolinea sp. T2]|uniref:response regulator n=1 Tax=Chryseolinea sp. T2 TaxID=3129255 RepID=UPI0030785563